MNQCIIVRTAHLKNSLKRKKDQRFLGFKFVIKTRNESMSNSKNSSSQKFTQKKDQRFLGFKFVIKTRNGLVSNSKNSSSQKFTQKKDQISQDSNVIKSASYNFCFCAIKEREQNKPLSLQKHVIPDESQKMSWSKLWIVSEKTYNKNLIFVLNSVF